VSEIKSHRDLVVWQKSMTLAATAYRLTQKFPTAERYRITDQLLRAAASVPAIIAEGHGRGTRKDYAHLVAIARGSLAETETFLLLAVDVGLVTHIEIKHAADLVDEIERMINALLTRLRAPKPDTPKSHP
jgi:four helix bundle protein